ncbi:MAG: hypothetical protein ACOH5I_18195 [Oligoflexus sp.]
MTQIIYTPILLALAACGGPQSESQLKEEWNAANNPVRIGGKDLEYKLAELPLAGKTRQVGWSDDYWPTYKGGLSYRWRLGYNASSINYKTFDEANISRTNLGALSPAEKYDIFMGSFNYPLVHMERARTKVLKTIPGSDFFEEAYEIPAWEGLCHGWAAAANNFKEPKAVTMTGPSGIEVPFTSSDIKALLTFYQQYRDNGSVKDYFMSERCNVSFTKLDEDLRSESITEEEYRRLRNEGPCKGVNPGAFHVIIANEIGKKKDFLVMDITRDAEVWNQPINSYTSEVVSESLENFSENAAPGTVKEVTLKTLVNYSVETAPNLNRIRPAEQTAVYEYSLELNEAGEILGGTWISDMPRPDFLWRQTKPEFRGYFELLQDIYEESTVDLQ